jgi:hypothetical protein
MAGIEINSQVEASVADGGLREVRIRMGIVS